MLESYQMVTHVSISISILRLPFNIWRTQWNFYLSVNCLKQQSLIRNLSGRKLVCCKSPLHPSTPTHTPGLLLKTSCNFNSSRKLEGKLSRCLLQWQIKQCVALYRKTYFDNETNDKSVKWALHPLPLNTPPPNGTLHITPWNWLQ